MPPFEKCCLNNLGLNCGGVPNGTNQANLNCSLHTGYWIKAYKHLVTFEVRCRSNNYDATMVRCAWYFNNVLNDYFSFRIDARVSDADAANLNCVWLLATVWKCKHGNQFIERPWP